MSLQVQCAECHPEHGLRCQLNPHPATIKHYAVRFESPMEFYTWASDEELAVWPAPPTNVRLVTRDGQELPVDLIYLGKQECDLAQFARFEPGLPPRTGTVTLDVWTTSPPCSRQDMAGTRVGYMPPLCLIKVDRGNA